MSDARASIDRAIELAPGRIEYRLRWADVRILQGALDDAKGMLTTIAAVKTDPDAAAAAKARLERIAALERAKQPGIRAAIAAELVPPGYRP